MAGTFSTEELDLGVVDELVHPRDPVRYELTIQKLEKSILVRGRLELGLDCECARCLEPFRYSIRLDHWTLHLPLDGPEAVTLQDDAADLTPYIREDILLELPQHPLCKNDCAGLSKYVNATALEEKRGGNAQGSSTWSELNKLKFE